MTKETKKQLPKLDVTIYSLDLPISKKKVSFRHWNIKETKILIMSLQQNDKKDIYQAIRQVANNCLVSNENIDNLPLADVEYLFTKIRCQSVGASVGGELNSSDISITSKEGITRKFTIDLDKVSVNLPESNKLELKDLILHFKPVTIKRYIDSLGTETNYPRDFILSLNKMVYKGEEYDFVEYSISEIEDFLDSMMPENIVSIKKYYKNIPRIFYAVDLREIFPELKSDEEQDPEEYLIKFRGISDFFG